LQNSTPCQRPITDTDFAAETANLTRASDSPEPGESPSSVDRQPNAQPVLNFCNSWFRPPSATFSHSALREVYSANRPSSATERTTRLALAKGEFPRALACTGSFPRSLCGGMPVRGGGDWRLDRVCESFCIPIEAAIPLPAARVRESTSLAFQHFSRSILRRVPSKPPVGLTDASFFRIDKTNTYLPRAGDDTVNIGHDED